MPGSVNGGEPLAVCARQDDIAPPVPSGCEMPSDYVAISHLSNLIVSSSSSKFSCLHLYIDRVFARHGQAIFNQCLLLNKTRTVIALRMSILWPMVYDDVYVGTHGIGPHQVVSTIPLGSWNQGTANWSELQNLLQCYLARIRMHAVPHITTCIKGIILSLARSMLLVAGNVRLDP